jgi:hypothetical protein
MNWQDDPEFEAIRRLHQVRNGLIRAAIIWTPLFLATLGACIFYAIDTATGGNHGGTSVLVVVLGIAAFLFGFQSIQALLDLFGEPAEETGFVQRRWARRDSFVFQTQYIRLDKRILRGDQLLLADIKETDYIRARFYPHSSVLVEVEKLVPPGEEGLQDSSNSDFSR